MNEWQPIDTAPKDHGQRLLCLDANGERFVAFWSVTWREWLTTPGDNGVFGRGFPTQWMPLP